MVWRWILATVLSVVVILYFNRRHDEGRRGPDPVGQGAAIPGAPAGGGVVRPALDDPQAAVAAARRELIEVRWGDAGSVSAIAARAEPAEAVASEVIAPAAGITTPLAVDIRRVGDEEGAAAAEWNAATWTRDDPREGDAAARDRFELPAAEAQPAVVLTRSVSVGAASRGRHFSVQVRLENPGDAEVWIQYRVVASSGLIAGTEDGRDVSLIWGRPEEGRLEASSLPLASLPAEGWSSEGVDWVGSASGGWMTALRPRVLTGAGPVESASAERLPIVGGFGGVVSRLVSRAVRVPAKDSVVHDYELFVGPRGAGALEAYADWALDRLQRVNLLLGPRYRLVVDTSTGSVVELYLRGQDRLPYGSEDERTDYRLLRDPLRGPATLSLEIDEYLGDRGTVPLGFALGPWSLRPRADDSSPIVLESTRGDVRVLKTFAIAPANEVFTGDADIQASAAADAHGATHFGVSLEIENLARGERSLFFRLAGPCAIHSEDQRAPGWDFFSAFGVATPRGGISAAVTEAEDLPEPWERSDIAWVGISSAYFASAIFPRAAGDQAGRFLGGGRVVKLADPDLLAIAAEKRGLDLRTIDDATYAELQAGQALPNMRSSLISKELAFAPGAKQSFEFVLFAAPRKDEIFARYESVRLEGLNDFGKLHSLVRFFKWLLGVIHAVLGSWGLAIIVLTILVKLILHPINRRSQRSMMRAQKQMQRLKPMMEEIKAKYGQDRLAQNREMQKLFREQNFNPAAQMGGCLMILLQMPIWIGLYRTLGQVISLRQAQFLWIDDLTLPDRLVNFDPAISLWITSLASFNLLPILYVILSVVNQRLQPKPDDPQMQMHYKMMTFMLILFGAIFYRFPSGFMLYIMTSSALGIIESKIIKAQLNHEDLSSGPAPNVAGGGGTAGGAAGGSGAIRTTGAYTIKKKNKKK